MKKNQKRRRLKDVQKASLKMSHGVSERIGREGTELTAPRFVGFREMSEFGLVYQELKNRKECGGDGC